MAKGNNKKKLIVEPPPHIQDDLEKQKDEDQKDVAEEKGKKLGFLIASLEISTEEREALFGLLPQMTEAQLDELTNVLEANYLQAASKNSDEQLTGALNSTKEKYQQTVRQMNANTAKELDSIA